MSDTPTPEPAPRKWAIDEANMLKLDTNHGPLRIDVCARCGAVVHWEGKAIHDQSHLGSLFGIGF